MGLRQRKTRNGKGERGRETETETDGIKTKTDTQWEGWERERGRERGGRVFSLVGMLKSGWYVESKSDVHYGLERDQGDGQDIGSQQASFLKQTLNVPPSLHSRNTHLPSDCFICSTIRMFALDWKWGLPATRLYTTKMQWTSVTKIVRGFSLHFLELERV